MVIITNEDNMKLMARYEDNYFDLAIVDPPYGIDFAGDMRSGSSLNGGNGWKPIIKKDWDKETPKQEYFDELRRISKNQIIWGANHFISKIPFDSTCWVIWDKMQEFKGAMFEMAWTSFNKPAKAFRMSRAEAYSKGKIHPTQKPVCLYEWLLHSYAKKGDKILDTHLGSGSIAIACHNMNFDLTACELDKDYFDKAMKRIKEHTAQQRLW